MTAPREFLALLEQSRADPLLTYQIRAPGLGGMSPGQRAFHTDPSRLRYLLAATQVGKTRGGSAEVWWHAGGTHPYRETPAAPNEGWIMTPDLDGDWPKICAKLREVEPPGVLHDRCSYDTARGYRYGGERLLVLGNGSVVRPKSGTQQLQTLEGASLAWAWIDEVPREGHWFALLQRVAALHGHVWATFTPVGRPAGWLKGFLEGDRETGQEAAPGWSKHKITLTPENVPHRPPEWIEDQIALMDPWEIPQRRDAEWDGPAPGRRFPSWRPELVIDLDTVAAIEYDRFRIGIDHGEGVGKQRVYLIGLAGHKVVVISEWGNTGRDCTATEVAAAIVDMLAGMSLTIHHVEMIVGDINTVGLGAGGGVKFNVFLEHALCKALGMRQLPRGIDIPRKGRGSVLAGESAINAAMKDGLFLVHETCYGFVEAARTYTGKEQDLKDRVDGVRYAVEDVLLDPTRRVYEAPTQVVTL